MLKARETWPRTSKVYCHRDTAWPEDPEIIEQVPVRSCVRRGAAIDLVLERGRENRSQFVITRIRGGREAIFWQSARTTKKARPNVSVPTARAHGLSADELTILVDSHERYAWKFAEQQAATTVQALRAGDYGVELDGQLVASVERKSCADLISTLTSGKLRFVLADLATLPHAAVVVEDRYSAIFKQDRVRPAVVADGLAECAARWPSVPIQFCEDRKLAQEWTFRFLGAALAAEIEIRDAARVDASFVSVEVEELPQPARRTWSRRTLRRGAGDPDPAVVRAWALTQGLPVAERGRIKASVLRAYLDDVHPAARED